MQIHSHNATDLATVFSVEIMYKCSFLLRPLCAFFRPNGALTRTNFGPNLLSRVCAYDFAGYRLAVEHILAAAITPGQLFCGPSQ